MEQDTQNGERDTNHTNIDENKHYIYNNNQDQDQNINNNIYPSPDKSLNHHNPIPDLQSNKLSLGFNHGCSISLSSSLSCWGSNTYHQSTIPAMTLP